MIFEDYLSGMGINATVRKLRRLEIPTKHGADEYYRRCLLGHSHDNITDKVYTHANIEKLRETVLLVEKPKKKEKNISEDKKRA